ncbi:transposase DDE domain protein [Collimonas pratensis]|uniref:Transposase DDE domain protein n=1 Tax=Collimonas pratensis TaxID=279113 RepID=A0ABM5ZC46_9BURK|nr:transposase DDE domain protein [Collimonas pratensis]
MKVVVRHVWERAKEAVNARRLTEWGKRIYARRKETVERSFADAKQLHCHRYARMRGLRKVMEQCLLGAACQNMKKIALLLARLLASLNVQFDRIYTLMRHFLLHDAFLCRSPVF